MNNAFYSFLTLQQSRLIVNNSESAECCSGSLFFPLSFFLYIPWRKWVWFLCKDLNYMAHKTPLIREYFSVFLFNLPSISISMYLFVFTFFYLFLTIFYLSSIYPSMYLFIYRYIFLAIYTFFYLHTFSILPSKFLHLKYKAKERKSNAKKCWYLLKKGKKALKEMIGWLPKGF